MALFESSTSELSAISAYLFFLFTRNPLVPYDNVTGLPGTSPLTPGGILNVGHDRPYRFSFYSNALSATIHARSLSELPADGQTFEELFSGISPLVGASDDHPSHNFQRDPTFSSSDTASSPAPGLTSVHNHQGAPPPNFAEATFSSNGNGNNRRVLAADPKMEPPARDNDADNNTWWLDVLNPTDEEMKMLSKVSLLHLPFSVASLFLTSRRLVRCFLSTL
jgi:magnesium transporter